MDDADTPLGRLEDLPADYRQALEALNLVPLWPSLRALLPPHRPRPATRATAWRYADLKPLLLRAGALTPIDKAERRVLVLANPGHGLDAMKASPAIYLGLQLLLPGEWAPSHRHTPNAVRMVVEGDGAWTTVDGEKCPMQRGDLILTPTGLWHEHGHDGSEPVVWLDVLDLPLVYHLEASYHVNGARQANGPTLSSRHVAAGLLPAPAFERGGARTYPMLRYPWARTRAALEGLAEALPAGTPVQLAYVNPETGAPAENILGFGALMLRPGETIELPARSPAAVWHVIEGGARLSTSEARFELDAADTAVVPGYTATALANTSAQAPAFLFVADEEPLHRKLGLYEQR